MNILGVLLTLTVLLALSGCKLVISVPEGGSVSSRSGAYVCRSGETCVIDVVDLFFDENFVASANPGFRFSHWKRRNRYFCGSETNACHLYTASFEGKPTLMNILASEQSFYLEPVFVRPNRWDAKAEMTEHRADASGCSVNGKLYVIGGRTGFSASSLFQSVVEEYNPETDSWKKVSEVPTARKLATASAVDGKCYVIGGQSNARGSSGPAVATVEVYDPSSNSWSTGASMPTARFSAASAVVDGKIYVVGGGDPNPSQAMEVYDPQTNQWQTMAAMPDARKYLGAAAVKGKVYAIGGALDYYFSYYMDTVQVYDPVTNSWRGRTPMPVGQAFLSVVAVNDRIYAFGGFSAYWQFDSRLFVYNPNANTWSQRAGMPSARGLSLALAVDGKIYSVGGVSGRYEAPDSSTVAYSP